MGKVQYFTILLQKPSPIYFPGETIIGCVNVKVTERLKINSFKCLVDGSSNVHWWVKK